MKKEPVFFIGPKGATFVGIDACESARVQCGEEMLAAVKVGSVDAAKEKHVPVIEVSGSKAVVKVGSVSHPMTVEHHIAWICLKTEKGLQFKELAVTGAPEAEFLLTADDRVVAAYEFCNLHGIWKSLV